MKKTRHPRYARHRFPAEVISHAVWLYFRLTLSLRMVEEASSCLDGARLAM
jgi:putative transposase